MAEKEEVKVTCPECGHEVGVKEDGTKLKVHKVAGERCEGSDSEVQSPDTAPDGIDKGDPFDELEGSLDDEQSPNDLDDPETPVEPEKGTQSVPESPAPEFVHIITVSHSCPYLNESAWHATNAEMASRSARSAGYTLAGGEAEHIGTEPAGEFLHVRYRVPVK